MENEINKILLKFNLISLNEMDSVALMNRMDSKFVFNIEELPNFLEQLKSSYRILEVNEKRISKYESLYFDTEDFELYHHHQRGKLNRFKFRIRKYVESNIHFFEMKYKNNKRRTLKTRIPQAGFQFKENEDIELFLSDKSKYNTENLQKKIWINYSRLTLVDVVNKERVTIDLNLNFHNKEHSETLDDIVIAEVKQHKTFESTFTKLMHDQHIREGSLSKYCWGVSTIFPELKSNNFKPFFNQLKKI